MIGLRRNDFSSDRRLAIKRAYKKLYRSNLPMREALDFLTAERAVSSDVDEIVTFFKEGDRKRGFCPWPSALSAKESDE